MKRRAEKVVRDHYEMKGRIIVEHHLGSILEVVNVNLVVAINIVEALEAEWMQKMQRTCLQSTIFRVR